eukprot:scaffold134637_cov24-Prasinocladus_malaysianus.AAC.3
MGVEPPTLEEREGLLLRLLRRVPGCEETAKRVAQQSVGLLPRDLVAVCADAGIIVLPGHHTSVKRLLRSSQKYSINKFFS